MDMTEIGVRIRETRNRQNLSQAELGKRLGMSRATISGIETGKVAEVGIRKMMALCGALGLELSVGQRRQYPSLQELRQEQHEKKRA
jgi:HTH-type transcriptional regulator / antitoxin HipB